VTGESSQNNDDTVDCSQEVNKRAICYCTITTEQLKIWKEQGYFFVNKSISVDEQVSGG
jgi:hypothetical protein